MKFKFGDNVKLTSEFYKDRKGVVINSETMVGKTKYIVRIGLAQSFVDVRIDAEFIEPLRK